MAARAALGSETQLSLSSRIEHPEQNRPGASAARSERASPGGIRGAAVLAVALAPALAAVWTVPWFLTQDGPAHVYNAQILAWSFDPQSPFRSTYTIQWAPIPNWVGQLVLAGLVAALPAWVADRIMISLTLVGFASALLWLRWRVAGARGLAGPALLAALLAMNFAWLFGFTSFMLGACLFPITLGVWWSGRDRLSARRIAAISALLVLGYFCHLVSVGLTALGLVVLSVASPLNSGSATAWKHRLARTSASFLPLCVLGVYYLKAARRGGPMQLVWRNFSSPWSPAAWQDRLGWVDPVTLAIKDGLPFTEHTGSEFVLFAPVLWLGAAIVLWWYGRISADPQKNAISPSPVPRDRAEASGNVMAGSLGGRQAWLVLAALLLVGGTIGPDSLGPVHGEFLPQRVVLLGLAALVPIFDVDPARWPGRALTAALLVALTLQSAIVWDYALCSDRTAGQIIRAGGHLGRGQRIVTLLVTSRGRFRPNPLLHAENWLGLDNGNIIWNNYETLHYYFPVQFRSGIDRPHPGDLELVSLHEGPTDEMARLRDWERILTRYANSIDVIILWKSDVRLEAITKCWFAPAARQGDVQIFRRSSSQGPL
jgi:hypothetical protein